MDTAPIDPFDLSSVSPIALRDLLNRATNTLEPVFWPGWLKNLSDAVDKALGNYVAPFNARAAVTPPVDRGDRIITLKPGEPPLCDHDFAYQSTVYWRVDGHRIYGDRFYCRKCLDTRLKNDRPFGLVDDAPLAGTLPL